MVLRRLHFIFVQMRRSASAQFKTVTLNFLFIFIFINLFQTVFGRENTIVGIGIVIIMSSAMLRDLTSTPVKQFMIHLLILEAMVVCAFLVTNLPAPGAVIVNFAILLVLLYAFTFEYAANLYMPYILSYLFLLFISPVTLQRLPIRMLAMLVGAVCIIAYQLVMGRRRIKEVPRNTLTALVDQAAACVRSLRGGEGVPDYPQMVHGNLCKLSRLIFERRKQTLCISDASCAMLDAGRALEGLILLLYDMEGPVTPARAALLAQTDTTLATFRIFLTAGPDCAGLTDPEDFSWEGDPVGEPLRLCLRAIRGCLLCMTDPDRRGAYRKTALSLWVRVKAAMNVSSVRVVYALRVAALLTAATLLVQTLGLPHGKWLLFTLASVSLPYADDVPEKGRNRLFATLLGGCAFTAVFVLIPGAAGRTAFMMLAGYLTSYFTDYRFTFACSTVGALGGAALAGAFGLTAVGGVFLIRLGYIMLGILLAYAFHCLILPFRRSRAAWSLWKKYVSTVESLARVCHTRTADTQLYFSLLIQAYLQEEKLRENAAAGDGGEEGRIFHVCQRTLREANLFAVQ